MQRSKGISDEALMAAAARGDSVAADELYRRYADELRRYFPRLENRGTEADDLVQETFVRVMRYAASYDVARPFRGWLFTIARNVALAARRSDRTLVALDEAALASAADPAREYRSREAMAALGRALDALAESDRRVLLLGRIEGRSYREVANILGISEGAVKVRVFRALQRLREQLRAMGNPGGWLDEY